MGGFVFTILKLENTNAFCLTLHGRENNKAYLALRLRCEHYFAFDCSYFDSHD